MKADLSADWAIVTVLIQHASEKAQHPLERARRYPKRPTWGMTAM